MYVVYFIHFYYLEIYFDKNFSVKYSKQFRKIMGNIFVTSVGLGGGNTCFSQCNITTSKEPIFFYQDINIAKYISKYLEAWHGSDSLGSSSKPWEKKFGHTP